MKITYNSKRYNSELMEPIASQDHYRNGNFAGSTLLLRASDGQYFHQTISCGQDFNVRDSFCPVDYQTAQEQLGGMDMTDAQEARAVELELIEIVK
jgi:hypothetical protein